jgi:hypothetical protein
VARCVNGCFHFFDPTNDHHHGGTSGSRSAARARVTIRTLVETSHGPFSVGIPPRTGSIRGVLNGCGDNVRTAPRSTCVPDPVGRALRGLDRRLLRLDGASRAHRGIKNSRKNKNVGVELLPPRNGPRNRPIPTPEDGPHRPFGVPALVGAGLAKSAAAAKSRRFFHVPIVIKVRWDPVPSRGGRRNPLGSPREKPTSFPTLRSPSGSASSLPSGRVPGRLLRTRPPRHQKLAFEPHLNGKGVRGNAGEPKRHGFGDTAHRPLQLW